MYQAPLGTTSDSLLFLLLPRGPDQDRPALRWHRLMAPPLGLDLCIYPPAQWSWGVPPVQPGHEAVTNLNKRYETRASWVFLSFPKGTISSVMSHVFLDGRTGSGRWSPWQCGLPEHPGIGLPLPFPAPLSHPSCLLPGTACLPEVLTFKPLSLA